jgi:hypothetical protein
MTSTNSANGLAEPATNGNSVKMSQTNLDIVQLDLTLKNLKKHKNVKENNKFHGDELIGVRVSILSPYQHTNLHDRTNSRPKASLQILRTLPTTSRRSCRARIFPLS